MPTDYDLGTLTVVGHDVDKLTQALGIADDRFDDLVNLAQKAWELEGTFSESIEYLADNAKGSELVLALVFFGRIWGEDSQDEEAEDEEITLP